MKKQLLFFGDSRDIVGVFQRQAVGTSGIDWPDKKVRESGEKIPR
jgi:hypothetical protein